MGMKDLVITGVLLFLQYFCFAQNLSELQQKKQDAEKEIEYTTRLLNEAQKAIDFHNQNSG